MLVCWFVMIAIGHFLALPLACVCDLWRLLELRTYPAQERKRKGERQIKTLSVKTVTLDEIDYYNLGKAAEAWQLLGITKETGALVNARCARTHAHVFMHYGRCYYCRCYYCQGLLLLLGPLLSLSGLLLCACVHACMHVCMYACMQGKTRSTRLGHLRTQRLVTQARNGVRCP